ncbi:hypothetical protein [Trinickia fusca]|uniref:hypothetical protein n=1 Tax=Trinickia fusca TaxID=2419777 RepID=UPI001603D329|nr:hypothetical protein [Trinickia fusca]
MNARTSFTDALLLGGWVVYPLSVLAVVALPITFDRAYVATQSKAGRMCACISMWIDEPAGQQPLET